MCGITDENGEYIIKNVGERDYGLALTFPWQVITGKVIKKSFKDRLDVKDNDMNENIKMNIEMFDPANVTLVQYISDNKIKLTCYNPIDDEFEDPLKKEPDDIHAYWRNIKRFKEVAEQLYSIVGNKRVVLLRLQRIYEELKLYEQLDKIKSLLD